jgi:UDP-N-acetyl-D-galactosamine dehydrogenase
LEISEEVLQALLDKKPCYDMRFIQKKELTNHQINGLYCSALSDIAECNYYIITVPTPVDKNNRPDLTPIQIKRNGWQSIKKRRHSNL